METHPQVQPASPPFAPLPVAATNAAEKKEESRPRNDEKNESAASDREIYDNVACTD